MNKRNSAAGDPRLLNALGHLFLVPCPGTLALGHQEQRFSGPVFHAYAKLTPNIRVTWAVGKRYLAAGLNRLEQRQLGGWGNPVGQAWENLWDV